MNTDNPDKNLTPSERKRLSDMGLTRFKNDFLADIPKANSPLDVLIGQIMLAHGEVRQAVVPIVNAGGAVPTPENKLAMQSLLQRLYSEQFSKLSKDELEQALAWVYTSTAMGGLFPEKLGRRPSI